MIRNGEGRGMPIEALVLAVLGCGIKEREYSPREQALIAEAAEFVLRSIRDSQPTKEAVSDGTR